MTPENGKVDAQKSTRHRSPNYPGISLKTAVEKISAWYKADGIAASPIDAAMKHMSGGDPGRVLSALKSFGLVTEDNGRLKLTQRGIDAAARQPGEQKRQQAIKDAALSPSIYRELLKEYPGGLPSDTTLQSELVAGKKFNPKAVDDFIKDFRVTLEYSGISSSIVVDSTQDNEEPDEEPPIKIGDYVQWESQGILQFPIPRQVNGFSEDGEWAFVEGSKTGVPVAELSIAEPPAPPKPVVLGEKLKNLPVKPPANPQYTPTADVRQDIFSIGEGTVTVQWPASISPESFEDVSAWLDILKRKIGRSINDRRQAQKDRIVRVVRKLHSGAVVRFEDHGQFIWFRVAASDGTTLLLPYSEDQDAEFYERLSEEELEGRLHALSNNKL